MEINSIIPLIFLALAFLLPEFKVVLLIFSAISAIIPFYITESRKLRFDKNATKIYLQLSSLSNLNESEIAETVSSIEGYTMVQQIFKRTGKLKFPNYGRRSKSLATTLKLVLQTGRIEILSNAIRNAIKSESAESELQGLISSEKYNLIFSSITLGAILGVISTMGSPSFLFQYVIFQSALSSLWLFFISGKFIESFSFLPPLMIGAFYFATLLA